MTMPLPAPDPLLSGPFEPLRAEYDLEGLIIEGEIPVGLDGTLFRIGPNPQFAPLGAYNPLQGDGMVHAFRLSAGRVAYRNRWVRTRRWRLERAAGRALFATGDPRDSDPSVQGVATDGAANTSVVFHGGRLLALEEGHPPIEIAPDTLETIGPFDFGGRLPGAMTAHPHVDPETGELLAFTNFPTRAFDGALQLHLAEAGGELVRSMMIPGPFPALVHDFAITRRHVVFVVCPLTLSLDRIRAGGPPIAWEPQRGAWIGVMPRDGTPDDVRWIPAPACMVWHTVNAFDDGDAVQLDLCRQDAAAFPAADGALPPDSALLQTLERWTIRGDRVESRRLSDVVCEYPRIDERRTGLPYRYAFVAAEGGPGTGELPHRAIGRYDHQTGEMRQWRAPPRHTVSEPVFVARSDMAEEGDGWLLLTMFDEARDASALVVLDARDIEAGPVGLARLGHRVPAGFHGAFVRSQSTATV